MKIAMTQAKTGRSMKNWGIGSALFGRRSLALPRRGDHLGPRTDLVVALDDDAIAGLDAFEDEVLVVDDAAGGHGAHLDLVLVVDHEDLRAERGVALDGLLRDEERVLVLAEGDERPHEHPRQERELGVVHEDAERDLARARVDVDVGKDRKSTRLNSSHVKISYAVFCLKKKK